MLSAFTISALLVLPIFSQQKCCVGPVYPCPLTLPNGRPPSSSMALFHHHDAASTTTAAAAAASISAASPTSTSSSSCPAYPTPVYDANSTAGAYTLQHLSVIVGGACALIPTLISLILILFHATHLSNRHEQVKIIRITSVIAVFAIIAFVNIVIQVEGAVYLAP